MPGLVPGIHVLLRCGEQDVGGRVEPGHDEEIAFHARLGITPRLHIFEPISEITPLATSRFQMNSTSSAPIVAVMKPAP